MIFLGFGCNLWLVIIAHGVFDYCTVLLFWLGQYATVTGWVF